MHLYGRRATSESTLKSNPHHFSKDHYDKRTCANCGKPFFRLKSKLKRSKSGLNFCSRECKDIAQRLGGIAEFLPEHYGTGASTYRDRALKHYGAKCSQCGYDEHEQMLDVDHIDSDRTNNRLENLQVLCVWCHALKTRRISFHEWNHHELLIDNQPYNLT